MATRLDFVYDRNTGEYIHGNGATMGDNENASTGDASSWIQNLAYDFQTYSGTGSAPIVSETAPATYAPQSGGSTGKSSGGSFWNVLNGISGVIDGVRTAVNPTTGQPLNPDTPYYNQRGVPMRPGAPGTAPGPGSGFMDRPVLGSVTGGHLALALAALVAGYFLLKK